METDKEKYENKMNKPAKLDEQKKKKADANQHKNPPIRNQTAAQTDSIGLHLVILIITTLGLFMLKVSL